jgi:RNA polymerase sigma factor (sigma-70 family)
LGRFRKKTEQELTALGEDDLIAYLLDARAAGDRDASGLAVSMLVFGFMANIEYRVAMKVPAESVEDVSKSVLLSALASPFDGGSVGEFRNWIGRIVQRRIADFHRDPRREMRTDPLPTEHQGDDDVWGEEPAAEFEGDTVDVRRAIETAYSELNPLHQQVIDLSIWEDLPAGDVAERLDVSPANVHKITQRFRDRIDELFPRDGNTPS